MKKYEVVTPLEGATLASGSVNYGVAVIAEMVPFILVSLNGNMVWRSKDSRDFVVVSHATMEECHIVRERMNSDAAKSPVKQLRLQAESRIHREGQSVPVIKMFIGNECRDMMPAENDARTIVELQDENERLSTRVKELLIAVTEAQMQPANDGDIMLKDLLVEAHDVICLAKPMTDSLFKRIAAVIK